MAKIKVKALEGPYNSSIGGDVVFALVSAPKEGRQQLLEFMRCKAYIHDAVTSHVTGLPDYGNNYKKYTSAPIDMKKLRLLVGTDTDDLVGFKKKLQAAKKMLNVFETAAGWEHSVLAEVDHETIEEGVWLITGSKHWMRSPHMLSMATLIIRIAIRKGPVTVRNEKEAIKTMRVWSESVGYSGDVEYIKACRTKLFPLMKNFDQLFDGLSPKKCYDPGDISMHSNGIAYLGNGICGCEKLNKRLKEICKRNGKAGKQ